jgi:DNA-binding SARP family transcriptional activator
MGVRCALTAEVSGRIRGGTMQEIAQRVAVFTLGRFSIVRDGQALSGTARLPHIPIALLQALIALGGRDVSAALLEQAVWPDQGSIDPRNLLDNTLHRLRALLGARDAILVSDARLTLNPRVCWVDAWRFECSVADLLADTGGHARTALHLYQGHFLQREDPRPWLVDCRMRLRLRFMRLMLHEGDRLEAAGDWAGAADWYTCGLEVDPSADELHRRLQACGQRRPSAAARAPLVSGSAVSRL